MHGPKRKGGTEAPLCAASIESYRQPDVPAPHPRRHAIAERPPSARPGHDHATPEELPGLMNPGAIRRNSADSAVT
ncbi:hypothetical protein KIP69_13260 [Geobacter sulfurreducens]|uniref:hypothetical protein n=1 Tax=Geobacter sulfurreducens TaxID=35554 RepID=UPI0011AE256D|nr:hypothetical protein [Geobacter sulfurreducens]QVW34554.1 hypothetical protein KIP69_13260 [Geobacter sulfurreducens]